MLVIFNFTQLFSMLVFFCRAIVATIIADKRVSQWIRIDSCYSTLHDLRLWYNYAILPIGLHARQTYISYPFFFEENKRNANTLYMRWESIYISISFFFEWNIPPPLEFSNGCVKPFNASYLYQVLRNKNGSFWSDTDEYEMRLKFSKQKLITK